MTPNEELIGSTRKVIAEARAIGREAIFSATQVEEVLDALDAANAELSRLRSSPAPVVGGVPELTEEQEIEVVRRFALKEEWGDDGVSEDFMDYVRWGVNIGMRYMASRLPALKPGEVETLLRIESCVRSVRDCGPEYIGTEERRLLDRLDAIRAQPTPTEKETA